MEDQGDRARLGVRAPQDNAAVDNPDPNAANADNAGNADPSQNQDPAPNNGGANNGDANNGDANNAQTSAPPATSTAPASSSSPASSTPLASLIPSSESADTIASLYQKSDPAQRPTDIFFPFHDPQGPVFLDDGGCTCSLRPSPDNTATMYRCLGNNTMDPYDGISGKWFSIANAQAAWNHRDPWDGADPPHALPAFSVAPSGAQDDASVALLASNDPKAQSLSVYDAACSAKNQSSFSQSYYEAVRATRANQAPVSAAPCYNPQSVPIQMVNLTSWQQHGCAAGFHCPNNTVNSLPMFCTPIELCLKSRLSGITCSLPGYQNGTNQPMGPFEPVVCSPGYYCPPPGREQQLCPAGFFCPEGSATPQKCSPGSHCPPGSRVDYALLPLGLLIMFDGLLVLAALVTRWYGGMRRHRTGELKRVVTAAAPLRKPTGGGYGMLPDAVELAELEADPVDARPVEYGLAAALSGARSSRIDVDASPELQAFVASMKRAIQGADFGLTYAYRGLSFAPKKAPKPILEGISGSIRAGTLCAVMGGSGAGKSTFVNVLMGKVHLTSGRMYVNGVEGKMSKYKSIIGYVPQDDIVIPELTVRENILHSARIRLPKTWAARDVEKHVDAVIDCLEIAHVQDSPVGTVAKPVISGGQRKRVSIGMELAAAPMSLFLDEPTSGLDATSAGSLMKMLKALSRLGISVVVIIHQPRMEIFDMIDELVLLGNGKTIYEGPQNEVQGYFQQLGYHAPAHANLSDVVTDIITGHGRDYNPTGPVSKDSLIQTWHNIHADTPLPDPQPNSLQEMASLHVSIKERGAPYWRQTYFCLTRAMTQQWRTISSFCFEMLVAAAAGFLIGLAQNGKKGRIFVSYFNDDYAPVSTATDYKSVSQLALLICIAVGLVASSPAVKVFAEEKLIYRREAEAGHSRLAYYLAKVVATLPRILLGCLHFTVLVQLLGVPLISFADAFAATLLYYWCVYGFASIVAMLVRRDDAPLLAVMASLIIAVLSGAAPPMRSVKSWHLEWLWRTSPGTWIVEAYWDRNVAPLAYLYDVPTASEGTGLTTGRFGLDCAVLFVLGFVYRIVAFGGLVVSPRLMA